MQQHLRPGAIISPALILATLLGLTACSSGGISELVPDRRPDYRSSRMENALEVPPDLLGASIDSQYNIPDLNPSSIATYNAYAEDRVQRNQRGYIEVLPPLPGVNVIENAGQLPYIVVNADPETTWRAVKRYWNQNGIRLTTEDPAIGLMETDWLINQADLPTSGLGGLLNGLLSFVSDTGERDRYRIRFDRNGENQTAVTLIYSQSVEKAQRERGNNREITGYKWEISDNDNPELQLEMTRRVALYIASELRRRGQTVENGQTTAPAHQHLAQIGQTQNGLDVLIFNGAYDQAWRALGNALDNASYAIENADYRNGTYRVQYQPQSEAKNDPGLWDRLWGNEQQESVHNQPIYLVRLADQGQQTIALIQNADGSPAPATQARQILEAISNSL